MKLLNEVFTIISMQFLNWSIKIIWQSVLADLIEG